MEQRLAKLSVTYALLIGVLAAFLYWSMWYDDGTRLKNKIKMSEQEIQRLESEIASVQKAITDAERYQQTMSVLGGEMKQVVQAMPAKLTSLDFMRIISNEAKSVGAEINQITSPQSFRTPDPTGGKDEFYEEVPIEVDLSGSYNQVMLFLSNLTRIDKIVTVKQLNLALVNKSGAEASKAPRISMKGSLLAYRYLGKDPSLLLPGTSGSSSNSGGSN